MMDDDLIKISDTEKEDATYVSIFENNYNDFDEQILGLEDVEVLKNGSFYD